MLYTSKIQDFWAVVSGVALILLLVTANLQAQELTDPEAPLTTASEAENQPDPGRKSEEELCDLIEAAASQHGIPAHFLTRLLWKESRFRSDALSPKGAQGIAQFMPDTAAERGLLDPFDARMAIPASASFLSDLRSRFGNLGLAAAAYNAGPNRVADWLGDTAKRSLPWETQDFVQSITGIDADTWADPEAIEAAAERNAKEEDCTSVVAFLKVPGQDLGPTLATAHGPWGVQVAGNFSRAWVMNAYARLQKQFATLMGDRPPMVIGARMRGRGTRVFYRVRVPMQTRKEAEALCTKIRGAGGSCIVLK